MNLDKIAMDLAELLPNLDSKTRPIVQQSGELSSSLMNRVLLTLILKGPLTMKGIAGELSIAKQQLTPIINKLIELHMVERKCVSKDRRQITIIITTVGEDYISIFHSKIAQIIKEKLKGMKEEDLAELESALVVFYKFIREVL